MVASESVEVAEAVVHTQPTRDALNQLQTDHYPDTSIAELERAVASGAGVFEYVGDPTSDPNNDPQTRRENAKAKIPPITDFDRVEVPEVAAAPDGTIKIDRVVKTRDVQKSGLVHKDEVKDSDTVIW